MRRLLKAYVHRANLDERKNSDKRNEPFSLWQRRKNKGSVLSVHRCLLLFLLSCFSCVSILQHWFAHTPGKNYSHLPTTLWKCKDTIQYHYFTRGDCHLKSFCFILAAAFWSLVIHRFLWKWKVSYSFILLHCSLYFIQYVGITYCKLKW